jgi:hypothetical protein
MNWNWAWVGAITTLIMGPWNFGVAGERPVFRAQGGVVYPESYPGYHQGGYYEDCEECEDGHCSPFGRIHYCWNYLTTLGGKPCEKPRGLHQRDMQYLYRYRAPHNLKYPPANQPAGVVVYPYYTLKGPDDFFLNE